MANSFTIRDVPVEPGLVLAPMSGVTNSSFRRLIGRLNPGALGLSVTEFISIEGLTRNNRRSLEMMHFRPEEAPLSIQIFGYDIDRMVDAALMVQDTGADIVDINCGCPAPKVVKRGGGCELMRQPEHLERMLRAVRKAVSIPLTLKIRSGWDEESRNGLQIAKMAEDCGVEMLAIHGRTRKQLYRGEADWDFVRRASDALRIPVVGSGDVLCVDSARERLATGVAGLMIGRGAMTNPWIFSELHALLNDMPYTRPGPEATVDVLFMYMDLLREDMPDKGVIGRMKQLAGQITRRIVRSSVMRKALCRSKTLEEMSDHLFEWKLELEAFREKGYELLHEPVSLGESR